MSKKIRLRMGGHIYDLSDVAYIETIGSDGEKQLWVPEDETRTSILRVTTEGVYKPSRNMIGFSEVDVESIDPDPDKTIGILEVTENGIYRAATDPSGPYFGYSKVIVGVGYEDGEVAMDIYDITLRHLPQSLYPDELWIISIENGYVIASRSEYSYIHPKRYRWRSAFSAKNVITAAIEFDGDWVLRQGEEKYTLNTQEWPWFFWVNEDYTLYGQYGNDEETKIELGRNVTSVYACRGYNSTLFPDKDQGLIVAYIKSDGKAFYRQYVLNIEIGEKQWLSETELEASEIWDDVRVHRLNDYRVGFELSNKNHNIWLISERNYVGQAAPPQIRKDSMAHKWLGVNVIRPSDPDVIVNCYRGKERPFEGEPRVKTFVIDFMCDVRLYGSSDNIIITKVNGVSFDTNYTCRTEDHSLIVEYEQELKGIVEITVKPWTHYLVGNGISYMFTDSVTYTWEVVRRIVTADQRDTHIDSITNSFVSIVMEPLINVPVIEEEIRNDDISQIDLVIDVKEVALEEATLKEVHEDRLSVTGVAIVITQIGEHPI